MAEEEAPRDIICNRYYRYQLEWSRNDDLPILTIFSYDRHGQPFSLSARFIKITSLRQIEFCRLGFGKIEVKFPLITSKYMS